VHESELARNGPSPCRSPPDGERRRPSTLSHLIEDVACEDGLSPLTYYTVFTIDLASRRVQMLGSRRDDRAGASQIVIDDAEFGHVHGALQADVQRRANLSSLNRCAMSSWSLERLGEQHIEPIRRTAGARVFVCAIHPSGSAPIGAYLGVVCAVAGGRGRVQDRCRITGIP
jgi:hypothetical protein